MKRIKLFDRSEEIYNQLKEMKVTMLVNHKQKMKEKKKRRQSLSLYKKIFTKKYSINL